MGVLVNSKKTVHSFCNTETIVKSGSVYEEVVCYKCGLKGVRRYMSDYVEVLSGNREAFVFCDCHYRQPVYVKVIECKESEKNPSFANMQPESVHKTVLPPEGCTLDLLGVWVNGADGKPIKLLKGEYQAHKNGFEKFLNEKGL